MPIELTQSKVLVLEDDQACKQAIKSFCSKNQLIPLTPTGQDPLAVLKTFVDLSGIFICEGLSSDNDTGLELAAKVHDLRPELPIFFRCLSTKSAQESRSELIDPDAYNIYHIDNIDSLKANLESQIFNQHYPNALLRGIEEIGHSSLNCFFKDVDIKCSTPYLVKDRIIRGQLFSLIPVESDWCKGYMMIQTCQKNILELVDRTKAPNQDNSDFRATNDILSEITNMVWGGLKNRFMAKEKVATPNFTQIPIIVNHQNQYISFGTSCPHLCFNYTITSQTNKDISLTIYHKFVFHINWDPDNFAENTVSVDDCLASGELEFF